MRQALLTLFILLFHWAGAAKIDSTQVRVPMAYNFKWYPSQVFLSKIPSYCAEFRFGLEMALTPRHTAEAGLSVLTPGAFHTVAASGLPNTSVYKIYGLNGMATYRYYPKDKGRVFKGPFVGAEVSLTFLSSLKREEYSYRQPGFNYYSNYSYFGSMKMQAIMSNYNFTFGYQNSFEKVRPNGKLSRVTLSIGGSLGFRFHYFWRHYKEGNLEYHISEGMTSDLYTWYRKFPCGGNINFSLGGW